MTNLPMSLDLKSISFKSQLTDAILSANDPPTLDKASAAAIASTALMIAELQGWSGENVSHSQFIPHQLVLLPPSATQRPSQKTGEYLSNLVLSAEKAAASQACSSILAGQSSESDDTGDIAFWLGEIGEGVSNEQSVLIALGLSEWGEKGNIVNGKPPAMIDIPELALLEDAFSFRVSSEATGGITAFFYAGKYGDEWAGLLGIGTLQ